MQVQAHRGFSELYPENTMLAFQKAYETVCSGIELDIHRTIDGEFVVMHDTTVDRTTNGTGVVSNLTWAYIQTLDAGSWFNPSLAGRPDCRVPSLEQVLDEYKSKPVQLVIQIKFNGEQDVKDFVDLVVAKDMVSQVIVSGWLPQINTVKTYNPSMFTQNDGMPSDMSLFNDVLQNAVLYNHNAVSINAALDQNTLSTMVSQVKAEGKIAHASYLSAGYMNGMTKCRAAGFDIVLGNDPEAMMLYSGEISGTPLETSPFIMTPYGLIETDIFIKVGENIAPTSYISFL